MSGCRSRSSLSFPWEGCFSIQSALSPCGRGWIAERSEGEPGEGADPLQMLTRSLLSRLAANAGSAPSPSRGEGKRVCRALALHHGSVSNSQASSARVLVRRRVRLSFSSSGQARGSGAPRRRMNNFRACEARHGPCDRPISPLGAPPRRFLAFGTVLPGAGGLHRDPGGFRRPSSAPRPAIEGSPT